MDLEELQNIHRDHYTKAIDMLTKYLHKALAGRSGKPLHILEVGPGEISILLQSISNCCNDIEASSEKPSVNICFVDKRELYERQSIRSKNNELSFDLGQKKVVYKGGKQPMALAAQFFDYEFNEFLHTGQDENITPTFDFIVMHSVLHELYIAGNEVADEYFPNLFLKLNNLLNDSGILFFADPYYPPYQATPESRSVIKNLIDATKHANAPVAFIHPEYLLALLFRRNREGRNAKFKLLVDEEMYIRIQGDEHADRGRKFYLIVLQKVGEAK